MTFKELPPTAETLSIKNKNSNGTMSMTKVYAVGMTITVELMIVKRRVLQLLSIPLFQRYRVTCGVL
jgi:hypothetical protein